MPYGLGDARIGLGEDTVQGILDAAWDGGIRSFDTAPAYGNAELRLGRWLAHRSYARSPFLISKFPALPETDGAQDIVESLDQSRKELGVDRIDLYLAHRGRDLLRPAVSHILRQCISKGKIGAFGASV